VTTAATAASKSTILVEPGALEGAKRYYHVAATASDLIGATHGTTITTGSWTAELDANGKEITPGATTLVEVVEVDGSNYPLAYGVATLNIG